MQAGRVVQAEGVLEDLDPAARIHQRRVEAQLGQRAGGQAVGIKQRGLADPVHLPARDALGRDVMGFGLLDLDEDDRPAVAQDQVHLSGGAAPAVLQDLAAALNIALGHQPLGRMAAGMGGDAAGDAGMRGPAGRGPSRLNPRHDRHRPAPPAWPAPCDTRPCAGAPPLPRPRLPRPAGSSAPPARQAPRAPHRHPPPRRRPAP